MCQCFLKHPVDTSYKYMHMHTSVHVYAYTYVYTTIVAYCHMTNGAGASEVKQQQACLAGRPQLALAIIICSNQDFPAHRMND